MKPIRAGLGKEARLEDVEGGPGRATCSKCPYSNTNKGKVRRHMKVHLDSPKPWVCATCRKSFAENHQLRRHSRIWSHHGGRRRGVGVLPLTPVKVKSKQEDNAKLLKDADDKVEALKRALEKKLLKKLKKVEQKIVLQHQQIEEGRENLKSLMEVYKSLNAEIKKNG